MMGMEQCTYATPFLHLPQPAMSIGQNGNSSTHVTRNTPAMLEHTVSSPMHFYLTSCCTMLCSLLRRGRGICCRSNTRAATCSHALVVIPQLFKGAPAGCCSTRSCCSTSSSCVSVPAWAAGGGRLYAYCTGCTAAARSGDSMLGSILHIAGRGWVGDCMLVMRYMYMCL